MAGLPSRRAASAASAGDSAWRRRLAQLRAEQLAGAGQPGLDRPDRHPLRERDFLVAQSVHLTQDQRRALVERQCQERRRQARRQFAAAEHPIRLVGGAGRRQVAVLLDVLIERDLRRAEAPPPPALPVARLVDDDAIDPGLQRRLAAESRQHPEDLQEDVLRQVEGVVVVGEQVERQLIDHPLVLGDEARRRHCRPRRYTAPPAPLRGHRRRPT